MADYFGCGGVDGCSYAYDPPPSFDLPPPPRPPWLEEVENCDEDLEGAPEGSGLERLTIHQLETCENTLILDANGSFENAFHSAAVVVVCAIIVVMVSLIVGIVIFR